MSSPPLKEILKRILEGQKEFGRGSFLDTDEKKMYPISRMSPNTYLAARLDGKLRMVEVQPDNSIVITNVTATVTAETA